MSRKKPVLARIPEPVPPRAVQQVMADFTRRIRNRPDICGIAYVVVYRDGSIGTAYAGHRDGQFAQVLAGVTGLQHRILSGDGG